MKQKPTPNRQYRSSNRRPQWFLDFIKFLPREKRKLLLNVSDRSADSYAALKPDDWDKLEKANPALPEKTHNIRKPYKGKLADNRPTGKQYGSVEKLMAKPAAAAARAAATQR